MTLTNKGKKNRATRFAARITRVPKITRDSVRITDYLFKRVQDTIVLTSFCEFTHILLLYLYFFLLIYLFLLFLLHLNISQINKFCKLVDNNKYIRLT